MWKRFIDRFGWHDWTEWDAPRWLENGTSIQYRKCKVCNKQQRHIL